MFDQSMRLILGNDANTPNPRINAVRKRKVDNTKLATKVDGWFSTRRCQVFKPGTSPPPPELMQRTEVVIVAPTLTDPFFQISP